MDEDRRWELVHVDDAHWLIRDLERPVTDPRRLLARVDRSDEGVEVRWLVPDIPLPMHYRVASDVIDDLVRWRSDRAPHSRPVEIASVPPFRGRTRRRGVAGL